MSFNQTRFEVRIQDKQRLGSPSLPSHSWPSYIVTQTGWNVSYPRGSSEYASISKAWRVVYVSYEVDKER